LVFLANASLILLLPLKQTGSDILNTELSLKDSGWAVVAHTFNPSTWEVEAGGFLSSRPAWSTVQSEFQDSQGCTEKPCLGKKKKKKKKKKTVCLLSLPAVFSLLLRSGAQGVSFPYYKKQVLYSLTQWLG
jgi:hypothetical protein